MIARRSNRCKVLLAAAIIFAASSAGLLNADQANGAPTSKNADKKAPHTGKQKVKRKMLTANQALKLVESRKEVQDFLAQFRRPRQGATAESKPVIDVERDGNIWNVHVYESLPDHTATFNWYSVDRLTGKITPMIKE
ncbi:MAG: hypothetical protein J0M35_20295 [Candidatus Obscuribacter phosphatis]|uniref:PepSY domain-containing protein n=1 Tax=Candidatus Obscuribacter phosphatis TaxID=1906157 RepID=A0A8J7TPD2_9BACT|nr:hypothetical protein [Candidatus Obscuribacter phosphatis]